MFTLTRNTNFTHLTGQTDVFVMAADTYEAVSAKADELRANGFVPRITATLLEDWHGVQNGTTLIVASSYVDWHDDLVLVCELPDGGLLPALGGPDRLTAISARFVG